MAASSVMPLVASGSLTSATEVTSAASADVGSAQETPGLPLAAASVAGGGVAGQI